MFKKLALAAIAISLTAGSAQAATITFYNHNTGSPTYSTAQIFENFGTTNATSFPLPKTVAATTNRPAVTETSQNNPTANTTSLTRARVGVTGATGAALQIRAASYTIAFAGSGVRYLSFFLGNFSSLRHTAIVQYVGQPTNSTNILAGLGIGALGYGTIVLDRSASDAAIQSITFTARESTILALDSFAAAAPEPAAWLMMILGFGLAGLQLRKRRAMAFTAA